MTSKDLEKFRSEVNGVLNGFRTQLNAMQALVAQLETTVKQVQTTVDQEIQNLKEDKSTSTLDFNFLASAPQKFNDLSLAVENHTTQITDYDTRISELSQSSLPTADLLLPQDLEFLKTGSHQIKTLNNDFKVFKSTCETSISMFRADLQTFEQSGHPSLSSVLVALTSVLKNTSAIQESVTNKQPFLSDPSCPSLISCYINYKKYKEKNGINNFAHTLSKSPSIFRIYLDKIKSTNPDFILPPHLSDSDLLRELLSKVYYPDGFSIDGFQLLISANPMKTPITVQTAYEYALFIKDVTEALDSILPQAAPLVLKCWDIVRSGVDVKHELSNKLSSVFPHSYDRFYPSLDIKIKSFFESSHLSVSSPSPPSPNFRGPSYHPNQNPQHRPSGSYSGGSSIITTSTPHQQPRTVANVSLSSSSCENCGISGHNTIDCEKEFCRPCHLLDASSPAFFHRPRDCVLFDSHDHDF